MMHPALYGSILTMGFMGSMHCGVMCGPLSCNFRTHRHLLSYHVGRLISYLAIVGLLFYSSHFLLNAESRGVKAVVSVAFAVAFVTFGLIQLGFIRVPALSFKLYRIQFAVMKKNKDVIDRFPVALGLMTGFFPCSWLYSFLLFATQLPDVTTAIIGTTLFWLSSIPAFFLFNSVLQTLMKKSPFTYRRISGVMLIVAGLFSVLGQWMDVFATLM